MPTQCRLPLYRMGCCCTTLHEGHGRLGDEGMCKPPPVTVKHADQYTTEDLNADLEAFRLAFAKYLRTRRAEQGGERGCPGRYVQRRESHHEGS
jgi:hypothetical protein